MKTTHLLYLHGFRSSPRSAKATLMAQRVAREHPQVHWCCPQLPPSAQAAFELLQRTVHDWPRERMAVVGSSLGGFYATCLAQPLGCPSVVLNPAVHPARDLARYIGEQRQWHAPEESFYFEPRYVDELRALEAACETPTASTLAIIAKGDEVLNWREMCARYASAQVLLLEGSDHALSNFEDLMDTVFNHLNLL
jgi:uncharacterized protein